MAALTYPPGVTHPWPHLAGGTRAVLTRILLHGAMPRAEAAKHLGLSKASLSRITKDLIGRGLLVEGATELRAATGRPSEMLHLGADSRHFLGIKLTGDHVYAVVTTLQAEVVAVRQEPLRATELTSVVEQIGEFADEWRTAYPNLTAVGVCLAGAIDRRGPDPIVRNSTYLGWREASLARLVADRTGLPTAIDNDVQALTVAEHWFGAGVGLMSMVLLTVGVGVGCGIVINGELVAGAHGIPGQVGHLVVDPAGPQCIGHRGCVGTYLVNDAIVRAAGGEAADPGAYGLALAQARAGDVRAVQAFRDAGRALGVLIGTVANLVDPERIILTGDGLPLYEIAQDVITEVMRATYAQDPENLVLDVQPFDFLEWARGGAALAIRSLLSRR